MNKIKALYVRLSKEDLKKEKQDFSRSINNQISYIMSYAKQNNIDIDEEYIDDGFSGINFDRPAFNRLIQDIESKLIDTIIVKDLSRLGRNFMETSYYITEYFPEHNIRFIAIDDDYDNFSQDADDKNSVVAYKSVHNDNFIKQTSKKIKETKMIKSKEKNFIGIIAPYGYKNLIIDNRNTFIIDKYAANIVKRIFNEIADGKTRGEVATGLNNDKIEPPIIYMKMTPSTNKIHYYDWTANAIYRMIKNVAYTGNLFYRKSSKDNFRDKKRKYICICDREIIRNTHEGIISEELFNKANNQLKTTRRRTKTDYNGFYKELVYCGECGRKMTILKRERESGNIYYHFDCTNTINRKPCKCRTISDSKLNSIVSSIIKKIIDNYVDENKVVDQTIQNMMKEKVSDNVINNLKLSLETSNNKIRNLYLQKTKGEISLDEFINLKNEETLYKEKIEKQLLKIQQEGKEFLNKEKMIKLYNQFTVNEDAFRLIVNELIYRIYIYKDNDIKINFKFGKVDSETIHLY